MYIRMYVCMYYVCVSVCLCVYIYIYKIHTHSHTHTHTHTHTQVLAAPAQGYDEGIVAIIVEDDQVGFRV